MGKRRPTLPRLRRALEIMRVPATSEALTKVADFQFYATTIRTILTENQSLDVVFEFAVNSHEHWVDVYVYCYARPCHEHLWLSAGKGQGGCTQRGPYRELAQATISND